MTEFRSIGKEARQARVAKITRQLYDRKRFAYLCVDFDWAVQEVSENLHEFGFASPHIGSDATDDMEFLVGIDPRESLDLPMISSPSRAPVRATLIPDENSLTIVIMDAMEEFHQQSRLQQKANENQLLLDTQIKLLAQIESGKQILEQQNIKLQEAARLQSGFLSGVSHEFRTPLTSIMGYTNLLKAGHDNVSEQQRNDYLSAVSRSSKHLLSLIENLLDHGKFDSNEIVLNNKPTNLQDLFKDVEMLLSPLATTKGVLFDLKLDFPNPAVALVDDSRLRQCLINLIGNAIKFTDEGSVVVTARLVEQMLAISIVDSGIGIEQVHLEKIRQPFWQAPDTGKSGTGLGLTITERIIEMMGGSLKISSVLNQGTSVEFDVLAAQAIDITSDTEKQDSAPVASMNMLLAEDDADIANLVMLLLAEQGVSIHHVSNGALAVEYLQSNSVDLVLMDLHMPIMDGYTAVESIRNGGDETPIVIMTASAMEADKAKAESVGCDAYLIKPVDIADLLNVAQQLIESE